ncbi:MAG: DAK2 domain-containing protein [Nocardiopsis sp. BM-2018]|nr:MAG: DAK2 domain-containing protein [Nocardiopsis sp. BM-2018]
MSEVTRFDLTRFDEVTRFDAAALRALVGTFRDAVAAHATVLDLLNVYPVPDGDTGTNMLRTLDAVVDEIDGVDDDLVDDLGAVCDAIGHGSLMGARGNSGVILSQILRGITVTLRGAVSGDDRPDDDRPDDDRPDDDRPGRVHAGPLQIASALRAGADGAYRAVMNPVEGTILTVARAGADAAEAMSARAGVTLIEVIDAARAAADDALERTPDMLPALRDAGVVDAGGAGLVLLFDSMLHVLAGRPVREPDPTTRPPDLGDGSTGPGRHGGSSAPRPTRSGPLPVSGVGGELDVSEQRYEVMYLLDLDDSSIDAMRTRWAEIGDSIVVVGGDGTWSCHIHTNDIGGAVEAALDVGGRPHRIQVTDLFEQAHTGPDVVAQTVDESADPESLAQQIPATSALERPRCGAVAVASGPGLATLFRSLGVAGVIAGGQTSNPSTAELFDAVEAIDADEVVILPNNKNIVAVAEQVDALSSRTVRVIATRTMPEGLSALIAFDSMLGADDNVARMAESIESVVTGEVTRAVRDAASPAGPVHAGDWIGLVRGEGIVAVASDAVSVSVELLTALLDGEREIVTVVTGVDADPTLTDQIIAWLDDEHAEVDVEVHAGDQPLYPYLFGVE